MSFQDTIFVWPWGPGNAGRAKAGSQSRAHKTQDLFPYLLSYFPQEQLQTYPHPTLNLFIFLLLGDDTLLLPFGCVNASLKGSAVMQGAAGGGREMPPRESTRRGLPDPPARPRLPPSPERSVCVLQQICAGKVKKWGLVILSFACGPIKIFK